MSDPAPPPAHVLEAFGAADPRHLDGGQGTSWLCGDIVLKPLDMPVPQLEWLDNEVRSLPEQRRVRLALPRRSSSGELLVDGWTASPLLAGSHSRARWLDIIDAGEALCDVLAPLPRPAFTAHRDDPWAIADRIAWGEERLEPHLVTEQIARLQAALRPVADAPHLIHGDLTGNVLLHPSLPPAVLDLSLYWRPPAYTAAIVVADALCFEHAGSDLVDAADRSGHFAQYLLRALLFRIVTDMVRDVGDPRPYEAAVDLACDRAERE